MKQAVNHTAIFSLLFLFFGSISVGFSVIGQTHYAIISIVIATIILEFKAMNQTILDEMSLSFELLSKMVTFGIAPMVLLVTVTLGGFSAVLVGSFYLVASAIRITYLNLESGMASKEQRGLPLLSVAIVLPVLSLLSWILPLGVRIIIWNISFLFLLISYVAPIDLPRIPTNFKFGLLALGILSIAVMLLQGPLF